MKREIKFRALKDDMSNCNFVYGQLVYDAIDIPRITHVDSSGQGLTFNTCIKGTEGQYTGFKDQNRKEIYEGDLISNINVTFTVFFDKSLGAFRCKRPDSQDKFLYELPLEKKYWVSGNIYETQNSNKILAKK